MKPLLLAALAAGLSACAEPPHLLPSGADPSDPTAPVRPTRYISVTAGTVDHGPVAPKPWTEQNQGVAPRRGAGQ